MIYKLLPTRVYRSYYGGENLDVLEGNKNPELTQFPEDWLASVTKAFNPDREVENEGLSKTTDGKFLKDTIEENKEEMIGKKDEMSLLFKLLDSGERLVIQVHPTVEFAKANFNSQYGKTECWYMLNDGGCVYIGFKPGITKEYMKELFEKQDIQEMLDVMHCFNVNKGDFIFVAGGVPHAIGKGCFMAELQEPTDLMVIPEKITPSGIKLDDRKLHGGLGFDKMFDCFVYDGRDRETTYEKYFIKPRKVDENTEVLVDKNITDKFRLYKLKVNGNYIYKMQSYGIALVIDGDGRIDDFFVKMGDRFFIPESEKEINISGNLTVLICQP